MNSSFDEELAEWEAERAAEEQAIREGEELLATEWRGWIHEDAPSESELHFRRLELARARNRHDYERSKRQSHST